MLTDGTWALTWDAENRLTKAERGTDKLEFMYDYQSRRVDKKVYSGTTLASHKRFVYDGYLQIEELDGLNNNDVTKKRIWDGNKLISEIRGTTTYYAVGDANKNITEYLDASGNIKAHYEYSPFGKITAKTGDMQDSFDYRFSSEYFDTETSFVYYNYRYYSPDLGRWLSRDPIGEKGGRNLYGMLKNSIINRIDYLGLSANIAIMKKAYANCEKRCNDCDETKKKKCLNNCISAIFQWMNAQSDNDNEDIDYAWGLIKGNNTDETSNSVHPSTAGNNNENTFDPWSNETSSDEFVKDAKNIFDNINKINDYYDKADYKIPGSDITKSVGNGLDYLNAANNLKTAEGVADNLNKNPFGGTIMSNGTKAFLNGVGNSGTLGHR